MIVLIIYKPFYETLFKKNITEYHLIFNEGFSPYILNRMKHGKGINMKTLDTLCTILNCNVEDIIKYEPTTKEV